MVKRLSTEEFINKVKIVHGDEYDYSKSVYINYRTEIIVICKNHGEFMPTPQNHLTGTGCPKCFREKLKVINSLTLDQFIEKSIYIHQDNYDYSMVKYYNYLQPVIIICKIHGQFLQCPQHHLQGSGCDKCAQVISKKEIKWLDILGIPEQDRNINLKINSRLIKTDAYDCITNTIYEFYGDFWHGNPQKYNLADINSNNKKTFLELYENTISREIFIKNNGYNLITIWEYDFDRTYRVIYERA